MVSFPQASPPTPCAHLSLPPYAPHARPPRTINDTQKVKRQPCKEAFRNKTSGLGRAEDNCLTTVFGIIDKKPFHSHGVECRIRVINEQLSGFLDHKKSAANKFKAIER
jgi:hypothetical protein